MDETPKIGRTLQRLAQAIESAQQAEARANSRTASAAATVVDAKARIVDADAQTAHADTHMQAAKAHMTAANAQMDDAELREADADREVEAARFHRGEYERALDHYQQLVRHRIANPLQVILGMASTLLQDVDSVNPTTRQMMLEAIGAQAKVLESIALFAPESFADSEHELQGRPADSDEYGSVTQLGQGSVTVLGDVQGDVDVTIPPASSGGCGRHAQPLP